MPVRKWIFLCLALLALCLCACGGAAENDERLLVLLEEGEGFSAELYSLRVSPGTDAVFQLQMDRGISLFSVDYRGETVVTEKDGFTELRLLDVRYPTRVKVQTVSKKGQIRYEANGGAAGDGSTSLLKNYSLTLHPRANTALGTDLFSREGYTLTSWNTQASGGGVRVSLGSRVTLNGGELVLYAQWARWSPEEDFQWIEEDDGAVITAYRGQDARVVIPAALAGLPVRAIASGAFRDCAAVSVILPPGLNRIEDGAFMRCALRELTLYDDLADFSDACFEGCAALQTLYINAVEAPFGYIYRKESVYADKVDLLILARGQKKLVFYGGCSMWYNLNGSQADKLFGSEYAILNLALNGTVNSAVQLQIMANYLEPGDILFHTPEISSYFQLMLLRDMQEEDSNLWCGLENNYDLFALVDLRTVGGAFDSLCHYLSLKNRRTDYNQFFSDDYRTPYIDGYGCIPFYRSAHRDRLGDKVSVNPENLTSERLQTLQEYYAMLRNLGVRIYVSCACLNLDALQEAEQEKIPEADAVFRKTLSEMPGVTPISHQEDYLYRQEDFYDTNYHLLSEPARRNTALWMQDLLSQMVQDGLWNSSETEGGES